MKQFAVLILFIALFSCKKNQPAKIFINPESISKTQAFLSDYADSLQYIPLSFDVPIRSIRAIEIVDGYIFIGAGLEGMLVFKRDGSFIKKIGNIGKGPGEYYSVNSFALDPKNKLIYILDAGPAAKVMVYTFDGELKYEFSNIHLQCVFQKIAFLDNKLFLFEIFIAGRAKYNWAEIDLRGNLVSAKSNSVPNINTNTIIYTNPIYKYENGLGYWNQYNDTIFRIENTESSARFFFAKGGFRLPLDNTTDLSDYFEVINIQETKRYIWLVEIDKPMNNVLIIDKVKNTNSKTALHGLTNDFDGGGNFIPASYYITNESEYLVGWDYPFQIKKHVASDKFKNSTPKYPEKKKELEQLANSLDENNNPVLMLVKLKE
jgi:hypothetical protein